MTDRPVAGLATAATGRRDAYYWRLCGTGASFFLFGLGQLVLGLLILPLLRLTSSGAAHPQRARLMVHRAFRLFIEFMRATGVLTYDFQGAQRLGRAGQLIVANHPSLIDVVFLLGFSPSSLCVVKQALFSNPGTRFAVAAAGYLSHSPTAAMIENVSAALHAGASVVMFPEGTRTRPGQPLQFHRGAANIAVRAATVLTPVFIRVHPTTLTKAEPWYRIPHRRPHFSLTVGEDIPLAPYRNGASVPIGSRALEQHLLKLFTEQK